MTVRRTARRGLTAVAGIAAAGLVAAASAQTAVAEPGNGQSGTEKAPQAQLARDKVKKPKPKDKLGQHDRQLLNKAIHDGAKRVTVILATEKGSTASVVKSLKAAGGWTSMVSDRLGYVSASVPTDRVDSLAASAAVLAVDLNESIPLPKPETAQAGTASSAGVAGPGASTPDDNPYMPTRDTGSVAFKAAHNTWDGRGITIGVLDSGVDLDHPALQTTSTGERKIVDWVTATHPLLEGDGSWRAMLTTVTGPTFAYAGSTWTAPAGTYKINRVAESISLNDEAGGDFNRDGDTTDRWGVLYDETTHDIWVDANQDLTFSAAEKMRPYRENFDVGHFGTDNPATAISESMPFVVEYREDVDTTPAGLPGTADFVNVGVVEAAHGTHVSGIAAGHSLFGGAMDGQAPGAKIVSSRACSWGGGCTAVALTDGMVDLVVNRGVDVVNMSIGGLPALNDGNNARARLYDTLVNDEGVQLVISAGNSGPGINTIGDPSVATDVISVASSITKETWLANYGAEVTSALTLHNYSSRGPREDGGFKPNVMAPGSAISSVPTWQPGGPVPEAGYSLPPGYAMFNGTSMASPQTAGGVALLLSAAKASGTAVTPRQLRDSLYTSADFVKGVEAIGQGAGQVDIPGAWDLLKTRPTSQDYTATAPVCTPISDFLATPDRGTGVYNRCDAAHGGQVSGVKKDYQVTVTRTSGASGTVVHNVRLVGNDGTFSVPAKMSLQRGKAMPITVSALTTTPRRPLGDPRDRRPGHERGRPPRPGHRGPLAGPRGADLHPEQDRLRRAQPHQEAVRDGPGGRQGTAGQPQRGGSGQPGPLDRQQPVRRARGVHLLGRVLHELQRPVLQQHLACVREPAAWGLGARDRGAAHDADAGQPVHDHRVRPGREGRPGEPDPAVGHRGDPGAGLVDRHQPVRTGQRDAAGRRAGQRGLRAQVDRGPRGAGVHGHRAGRGLALHRHDWPAL